MAVYPQNKKMTERDLGATVSVENFGGAIIHKVSVGRDQFKGYLCVCIHGISGILSRSA